ncbi:MAG: hypothetical protein KAJ14_15520 [Candidatus Omnitrophica bacterium]|nr:hypothetical protein [Candidatus Omnitrophota bacterium]
MKTKLKSHKGFILIEILVSLLLFTAGILFLVKSLSMITKSNKQIRENRLAYILIDNVYNQLYSGEPVYPGKVILDNKEFFWDLAVNNTGDGLKHVALNVTWGKNNTVSSASLYHTVIDITDR